MKKASLKPAVAYYRRSTKDQEASIREQRKAVQEYAAKHGYTIIREYVDDGISGDSTEQRHDFLSMLADADRKHDFQFILCWDQDRFGRFDPHEASFRTWPLRKAGIQLVTCNKGPIDWADFTEWLMYSVDQHGKHQFLRGLSEGVTRGQLNCMLSGSWIGTAPYGYEIEGDKKNKRLALGEPKKVKVIQRIFREYVNGSSYRTIAEGLNNDGIPSARGKLWKFDTVRGMLKNVAYVGDYVAGKDSYGKYNTITKDGVIPSATNGKPKRVAKDPMERIEHKDNHPAIVDRKTFAKAQKLMASRKRVESRRYTPLTNPFRFTGKLVCGRCGGRMNGETRFGIHKYRCNKQRDGGTCTGNKVDQWELLNKLRVYVENEFLDGKTSKEVWELLQKAKAGKIKASQLGKGYKKIRDLVKPEFPEVKVDKPRLEKELAKLDAKISKAFDNLLELDKANIQAYQAKIAQMRVEREELKAEIESPTITAKDIENEAVEILESIVMVVININKKGKSEHRDKFFSSIKTVTAFTKAKGEGNGTRYELERIEIELYRTGGANTDKLELTNTCS